MSDDMERRHLDAIAVMNKLFESRDGRPVESATMNGSQHRIVTRTLLEGMAALAEQRKRIADLEVALAHYVNVVESVNDPSSFEPKVRDAGGPARAALGARK